MKFDACISASCVPVSSHAMPRASFSTCSCAALEVRAVDVGDLELAARRRLQRRGDVEHLVVVEVQAGHRVRRLRLRRLLLEADRAAVGVELDDAVALGIADLVAEHGGAASRARRRCAGSRRSARRRRCCRRARARRDPSPTNSRPMMNACASPSGLRLRGVVDLQCRCRAPSPSSRRKPSCSCGVVMTRMSRMPASISVDSG